MLAEPALDVGMLMRPVVVQDHVNVEVRGDALIDLAQELAELDVAVARIARADDGPLQGVQGGEQGGGAVALVVMRHRSTTPLLERQSGLRTVQGLGARLLVNTQNNRLIR